MTRLALPASSMVSPPTTKPISLPAVLASWSATARCRTTGSNRSSRLITAMPLRTSTKVTFDYQFIANPGYNADRGPVMLLPAGSIPSFRLIERKTRTKSLACVLNKEIIMRCATSKIWLVVLAAVVASITPTAAKEFYVGEPVVKNEMQLVPHYLLGIEMALSMAATRIVSRKIGARRHWPNRAGGGNPIFRFPPAQPNVEGNKHRECKTCHDVRVARPRTQSLAPK